MLMVNQLVGFGAGGESSYDVSWALDTDYSGLQNATMRVVFTTPFSTSGNSFKITFEAKSSGDNFSTTACYIGEQGAGDAYDFASSPTQITFSGAGGFDIAAGNTIESDKISFSIDSTKNYVVAYHVANNASKDDVRGKSGLGDVDSYSKTGGDDTTTVDASGYTGDSGRNYGIKQFTVYY